MEEAGAGGMAASTGVGQGSEGLGFVEGRADSEAAPAL